MSRPDVRDERVPQIIDAAAQVFARDGIDGANMSEIAEAAGVSKATIYHYFASKEDLIVGHHLEVNLRESMIESVSTYVDGFLPP